MSNPALIGVAGTIAAAIVGMISAWLVRRAGRHVDAATVRRNDAETVAVEVKTARELLGDVKQRMVEQKAEQQERLAELRNEHSERILALQERHDMELKAAREQITELDYRVRTLAAEYAAHRAWDDSALASLRQHNPGYPSPPPIGQA